MRTVPVQVLKQHLASWLDRVSAGERVTITRRNRPLAELTPVGAPGWHVGSRFGQGSLEPLGFTVPDGAIGQALAEDRGDDR
jgi:prevent-host-death family protein